MSVAITIKHCKLCGKLAELKESHLVPAFVYRWMRSTSGTGHLRFGQTPNQRVQDGIKTPLLCEDCEGRLSVWEKKFAEQIFHPAREKNDGTLSYGPWFAKFAASVSWRVLLAFTERKHLTYLPDNVASKANDALQEWRAFILDEVENPGLFPLSFIPLGMLSSVPPPGTSPNINQYLMRATAIDLVHAKGQSFVFTKMCHCIVLGFIERPVRTQWEGTRINIKRGTVSQRMRVPKPFMDYLNTQAKKVHGYKFSQRQKEVISESYWKNMERSATSETFKAVNQDFLMFGSDAFAY